VAAGNRRGDEGYVAKDERSGYEGVATRRWLKVKQKGWVVEERSVAAADQRAGASRLNHHWHLTRRAA
jgi:hypothetical protein